jgi:hypothetical protein
LNFVINFDCAVAKRQDNNPLIVSFMNFNILKNLKNFRSKNFNPISKLSEETAHPLDLDLGNSGVCTPVYSSIFKTLNHGQNQRQRIDSKK